MGPRLRAITRGLRLRCPACGRGRLKAKWIDFADACPECRHVYLRDPGDWTGAAEMTFILTVVAGGIAFFAFSDFAPRVRVAATFAVALLAFALLFPRVRGMWIGVLSLWADPRATPAPAVHPYENDPEWEHPSILDP